MMDLYHHFQLQEELKILYCHEEIIDTREVDNAWHVKVEPDSFY